jgi:hypothetical protein
VAGANGQPIGSYMPPARRALKRFETLDSSQFVFQKVLAADLLQHHPGITFCSDNPEGVVDKSAIVVCDSDTLAFPCRE